MSIIAKHRKNYGNVELMFRKLQQDLVETLGLESEQSLHFKDPDWILPIGLWRSILFRQEADWLDLRKVGTDRLADVAKWLFENVGKRDLKWSYKSDIYFRPTRICFLKSDDLFHFDMVWRGMI
jgi:hypothetical protein